MDKAIINILIFNDNQEDIDCLTSFLEQPGHNIFVAKTKKEADQILEKRKIGIMLFSSEIEQLDSLAYIEKTTKNPEHKDCFIIVTGTQQEKTYKLVGGLHKGAVDFITKPFIKHLINAKINVFKRLHFKNKTILSLLENIFPEGVLKEFRAHNKYSPKKHDHCTILFTDFVGFSKKSLRYTPSKLIEILDYYFSQFDQIIHKYGLEKIKTIGDSYMAVGGLNNHDDNIEIKTTLAALEIKNFIIEDQEKRNYDAAKAWSIRIGIHSGALIAGVIGKDKYSFDVWGDSVNVAARCEQHSLPNKINVSEHFYNQIAPYFDGTDRGRIAIKNRGEIKMFFVEDIKKDYTIRKDSKLPNPWLRQLANLPTFDFDGLRTHIIQRLRSELDPRLIYHSLKHTLNVEKAVMKYGELEGLTKHELYLTRTAALFHDSGFLLQYDNNEHIGVNIFKSIANDYGYSEEDIKMVEQIILVTIANNEPQSICEKIMCDADLDYLGRKDYHITAENLFQERANYGIDLSEKEWLNIQINYLENIHHYYTVSANNIRNRGKAKRLSELKEKYAAKFGLKSS